MNTYLIRELLLSCKLSYNFIRESSRFYKGDSKEEAAFILEILHMVISKAEGRKV